MPRITLTFEKKQLWVTGEVISPHLVGAATLKFLLDTGASQTIPSLRDAEIAGLDVAGLPRSPQKSGGYGGRVELRLLESAMVVLASDDLKAKCIELPSVAVQYSPVKETREARMVYGIPTVLGVDTLTAGALTLWADWARDQAHLEYD